MMLDTKDNEQDETENDESRKSVADCLEHIQVILRLTAVSGHIRKFTGSRVQVPDESSMLFRSSSRSSLDVGGKGRGG